MVVNQPRVAPARIAGVAKQQEVFSQPGKIKTNGG
jgi:hypothetical protein